MSQLDILVTRGDKMRKVELKMNELKKYEVIIEIKTELQ